MVKNICLSAAAAAATIVLMPFNAMALEGNIRVHDPDIIKSGNATYVFSTGIWGKTLEARTSYDNGLTWNSLGDVFPTKPAWTAEYLNHGYEYHGASYPNPSFWAPDIKYFNNQYYLYYSVSSFGSRYSAIGLATNNALNPGNISSGWTDQGIVVSSNDSSNYNAIDPNLFIDDDGKGWLSYGSFWSGIKLAEIDTTTGKLIDNPTTYSIASRPSNRIEAPYIVKNGDFYYLYVSFDNCCKGTNSTYKVAVGRATEITGPYEDKNGTDMRDGGGTIVVKRDSDFAGKGHNAVYQENGYDYLVYHGYPYPSAPDQTMPQLMISLLEYENGWPVAKPFNGFMVPEPSTLTYGCGMWLASLFFHRSRPRQHCRSRQHFSRLRQCE